MRFSVDPWDPSYGASVEYELGRSAAEVAVDVEVPSARWQPIGPDRRIVAPEAVLFVDGVRRIDAQVWVDGPDGTAAPGLCASYAAGVVCCCRHEGAHLVAADIRRGLFTTAAHAVDIVSGAGTYRASHAEQLRDVAPVQVLSVALQRHLAEVELATAVAARRDGVDDLLVVDGPLHRQSHLPRAVGFVKSHTKTYLPTELGGIVAALGPHERTPVFQLDRPRGRYTWYLRLPCRPGSPWAGVARLECSADLTAPDAVALAARSQVTLGRFASTEYKDSRAPQNLYPIAGLERQLRRRLGEPDLLYRALRRAAA